jgi:hypothetical protein
MDSCEYISLLTTIVGFLLVVSEFLPYASSSKCNSIFEAMSHVFCKNSCLRSNKQIINDNETLSKEVSQLRNEILNLTTLRTSLEIQRVNEKV